MTPHSHEGRPTVPGSPIRAQAENLPAPGARPVFVFDGECGFCRYWVGRWRVRVGDRVEFAPFQEAAERFPHIPREAFARAAQWVVPGGETAGGAAAVFRLLHEAGGAFRLGWWLYRKAPGFAPLSEAAYGFVAGRRRFLSTAGCRLRGLGGPVPSYALTASAFLRLLSVIYLAAFVSLWTQIDGLIGSRGILPVGSFLEAKGRDCLHEGMSPYWHFPTLCWLQASDGFLHMVCGAGAALAVAGLVAPFCWWLWLLQWGLYLSLTVAGQEFLSFQWDILLLETGFLAVFAAPLSLYPRRRNRAPPRGVVIWLFRWLLFRLLFASGVVKLTWPWGLPAEMRGAVHNTWEDLTALFYHYQTQPLPPWTAWYAHQLPAWFQKASVAGVFFIEIAAPFLIFAPRRLRLAGCVLQVGFQVLILLTGNYCFFNLLTLALCVWLLDDDAWPLSALRRRLSGRGDPEDAAPAALGPALRPWPRWVLFPAAAVLIVAGTYLLVFESFCAHRTEWAARHKEDGWMARMNDLTYDGLMRFHVVGSYGLFRQMTTERPEIIMEGSEDGRTWKAYEFTYKPGDPARAPAFNIPHQPRLDWQMWFAALDHRRQKPWFLRFCVRLLQGSKPVLGLLAANPFPDRPPRYLRAVVYDYRFTDFEDRRKTGCWWRRKLLGLYQPVLSQERVEGLARDLGLGP